MIILIWGLAVFVYIGFRLWYDGRCRPLTTAEISEFMATLDKRISDGLHTPDRDTVRRFMEQDDGRDFVMVNLLKTVDAPAYHPDTGEAMEPQALLSSYFEPFMRRLVRRAGYPVITGRVLGNYLDEMNTPADPGWTGAGLIRYRSRRDAMLASLANESFDEIFKFKQAAIAQTFAVPTRVMGGGYMSPRASVALILALIAALTQIAVT